MSAGASQRLGIGQAILIALITIYRWTLSFLLGGRCRFYPSCSCYGLQAIRQHGAWSGGLLTVRRVLRCHPWHPGGYDPVPANEPRGNG